MKRKTIDAILAKAGIKPFPDSDPRYSEPLSITLLSRSPAPPKPQATGSTSIENQIDPSGEEDHDRPPEQWELVVSADDDTVESELLEWSGLASVWERCQERWDRNGMEWDHDFLSEVVDACSHVFIELEEYDWGPGRSGYWHRVETDNPAALRLELRLELARQLRTWRCDLRARGGSGLQPTAQELIASLARFKEHFGQSVAGRSIFEFPPSKVMALVEQSIKVNQIAPELIGESSCLMTTDAALRG